MGRSDQEPSTELNYILNTLFAIGGIVLSSRTPT
jgi:hypothetical protein